MKKVTLFSLLFSLLFSRPSAQSAENISGILKDGLRHLPVDAASTPLDFTVYRGDYIVFNFSRAALSNFRCRILGSTRLCPDRITSPLM